MAGATAGGSGGIFDRLRDTDPRNDVLEGLAIRFGLALAVARVGAGLVEVLFPKLFLRVVGKRGSATDGAALGFRMKGGRDVGVGLATLGAAALGDRSTFAQLTAAGIVIDGVDGLAVAADEGAALRGFVTRFGAPLGYAVAAGAAVAAWVLGRDA
jgi:hypothetical protein